MLNSTPATGFVSRWRWVRKAALQGLVMAGLAGIAHGKPSEDLTPAQIAERATKSIALIKADGGVGTGFVVAEDGRLATNIHVIRGATEATVVMANGKEYTDVEVVVTDEEHDLAILRIPARKLKPLPLGDSSKIKPGEHVVAIGHPLGLGNTVSDGLVSAVRVISEQLTVVQISAPISPGSSGGPVFNDRGEVIGVSTLVATQGQNLNFAMPVNTLKSMLKVSKGMSIAEFAAKSKGEGGRGRERNVPEHPVALLESCPVAGQRAIAEGILDAIDVGAPLYNQGNVQACYRVYSAAAVDIDRTVAQCEGPRRALLDGVQNADSAKSWDDKAWAMRDAFDGVLDVIKRQGDLTSPTAATQPEQKFARRVPRHSDTLLDDCDQADIEDIGNTIVDAIDSGAPLYNQGNTEGCYRVYEAAIKDIDRRVRECKSAKEALREGLVNADNSTGSEAKAWAVRDSFDGVLRVIRRRLEAEVEQAR